MVFVEFKYSKIIYLLQLSLSLFVNYFLNDLFIGIICNIDEINLSEFVSFREKLQIQASFTPLFAILFSHLSELSFLWSESSSGYRKSVFRFSEAKPFLGFSVANLSF